MNPLEQMRDAFARTAAQLAEHLAAHEATCTRCKGSRHRCAQGNRIARSHASAKRNAEVAASQQLKLGGAS